VKAWGNFERKFPRVPRNSPAFPGIPHPWGKAGNALGNSGFQVSGRGKNFKSFFPAIQCKALTNPPRSPAIRCKLSSRNLSLQGHRARRTLQNRQKQGAERASPKHQERQGVLPGGAPEGQKQGAERASPKHQKAALGSAFAPALRSGQTRNPKRNSRRSFALSQRTRLGPFPCLRLRSVLQFLALAPPATRNEIRQTSRRLVRLQRAARGRWTLAPGSTPRCFGLDALRCLGVPVLLRKTRPASQAFSHDFCYAKDRAFSLAGRVSRARRVRAIAPHTSTGGGPPRFAGANRRGMGTPLASLRWRAERPRSLRPPTRIPAFPPARSRGQVPGRERSRAPQNSASGYDLRSPLRRPAPGAGRQNAQDLLLGVRSGLPHRGQAFQIRAAQSQCSGSVPAPSHRAGVSSRARGSQYAPKNRKTFRQPQPG
jgi:hypothetical protein